MLFLLALLPGVKTLTLPQGFVESFAAVGRRSQLKKEEEFYCLYGDVDWRGNYTLERVEKPWQDAYTRHLLKNDTLYIQYVVNHEPCGKGAIADLHSHPTPPWRGVMDKDLTPSDVDLQGWLGNRYRLHFIVTAEKGVVWERTGPNTFRVLELSKIQIVPR